MGGRCLRLEKIGLTLDRRSHELHQVVPPERLILKFQAFNGNCMSRIKQVVGLATFLRHSVSRC
jgi:hypothetical protein